MRNVSLLIFSFIVLILVYVASSSSAALVVSGVTLLMGGLMVLLFGKSTRERENMLTVMLVSFLFITFATILQHLDYMADYISFSNQSNDNYKFYLASIDGEHASSINGIFNECVIQNIHFENGGYYFYIKLLSFLATKYSDGNHILLQQLGTALPSIMSSVVLYAIVAKYCPAKKTIGYSCFFMVLSPLILHSVGIHRDALIALFYFILIYLWLCKDFSLKVGALQVLLALILYYLREQHGLFALSFVVVSSISARKQNRLVYVVAVGALIAIFGATYLYDMISSSYSETNEFYNEFHSDRLSGLSSGIGRFVYMLPSPLKELAQVLFLQLRFPPWLALSEANNPSAILLGFLSFSVAFYWFYVFAGTVYSIAKKGIKSLPTKLMYGLLLLFAFLFLSSSNLDSRRVVCMYPLMYVAFVFYKEHRLSRRIMLTFGHNYAIVYAGICLLYLIVKGSAG